MLRWQNDWGATREHWETLLEMGRKVPDPFLERPDLSPEAAFYWVAFCDLATERDIGMSIGPIPRSKVKEYADDHHLSEEEWENFWAIIRDLDIEAVKQMNSKTQDKQPDLVSAQDPKQMKLLMERLARKHAK